MTSRYEVTIGGVKMSSLDKDLLILDVSYPAPEYQVTKHRIANLNGYEVGDEYLSRRDVVVTFELHIYNTAKRNAACQKVNEWARSANTLGINDRSGQYLLVRCEKEATISSVRNWTDPLTITFSTYSVPFWFSNAQSILTLSGSNASGTLRVDGNAGYTPVDVEITANSAISRIKAVVGSTNIEVSGLNVAANQIIRIVFTNWRYLTITANGASVLNKMVSTSSDCLLAKCGASNNASITANNRVTARFVTRGLWR